jgi:hypothetical protein
VNYFKGLFTTGREVEMGPSLQFIKLVITSEMNADLG